MKLSLNLLFLFFISAIAHAQPKDTIRTSHLVFELPIVDLPYQFDASKTVNNNFLKGYANPSMHQSLDLATDLYTGAHFGISKLFNSKYKSEWGTGKKILYYLTLASSDFVLTYAPGFDGWEHEEYHRAVMSRFHVNSYNDMNKFPIGSETVSVNHVTDEDLIRFKRESPADFIRSHAAGIEGEYLLVSKLQRNNFFYKQNLPHEIFYFFVTLNSIAYVQACSMPEEADKMTNEMNKIEPTEAMRDYTGLDFTAWTYDLFRPNEPYTSRGPHPSGTGLNRYIKTTDLTKDELSYLKKQGGLQWLNIVSPMIFGYRSIELNDKGLTGNFAVRHLLTSFGSDISMNVYLMNAQHKAIFALHNAQNYHNSFPSVEAQLIDHETTLFSHSVYVSPRVIMGVQPKNQDFKTSDAAFLGLAECKFEYRSKSIFHPYLEVSAKTRGWIAGNEFLKSNLSCRFGVLTRLPF